MRAHNFVDDMTDEQVDRLWNDAVAAPDLICTVNERGAVKVQPANIEERERMLEEREDGLRRARVVAYGVFLVLAACGGLIGGMIWVLFHAVRGH